MRNPIKLIDGMAIVKRERDAAAVYDADAKEIVARAPGMPWPIRKSKAMRERATGHKCYYVAPLAWLNPPVSAVIA